jgi:hypothetical protein
MKRITNIGMSHSVYRIDGLLPGIDETYVGITKDMERRERTHRMDSMTRTSKVYRYIRKHGGWENFKMTVIDVKDCIDHDSETCLEGYWIIQTGATLNTQVPGRTRKQYLADNRVRIAEHRRDYYVENKEQIAEKAADYYEKNKERFADYYEKNKENIQARRSVMHACSCGGKYKTSSKAKHHRTKKHQDYLI